MPKDILKTVDGEFCIFTAEPEGDVALPDGGTRKAWTEERLDQVVANFGDEGAIAAKSPDLLVKNPVVIGHEEDSEFMKRTDLPAAGWIAGVRREGKKLMASFRDMPTKVAKWIKDKSFSSRSAEFYPDYHGFGGTLRRVALVGGTIPAKKDLGGTIFFNENEPEFEVVTFQEGNAMTLGEMIAAVAGMDESARAKLMEVIATEAGASIEVVQEWLGTDPRELPGVVQAAIKKALGIKDETTPEDDAVDPTDPEDADGNTGHEDEDKPRPADPTDPEDKETENMAEKKKKKASKKSDGERIAELEAALVKQDASLATFSELLEKSKEGKDELKKQLATHGTQLREARETSKVQVFEAFADRMNDTGKFPGPTRKAQIVDALKKVSGVEKFDEGKAPRPEDVLMELLEEVALPVDVTGRRISADVEEFDETQAAETLKTVRAEWQDHVKATGSDVSFEFWAENASEIPKPLIAKFAEENGLKAE